MNKFLLIVAVALTMLSSCKTREQVAYFQDTATEQVLQTRAIEALKLQPGDKLSVIVTSSTTPALAQQFNLPIVTTQAGASTNSYTNQIALYTVDENGCIDVPGLGRQKVAGYTRSQISAIIQEELRQGRLRDAVVTVSSYDQFVTVLGDVAKPGRVAIKRDNLTLLEALGEAGDLNITACRDRIMVIRQDENNESKSYFVDIRSKNLFSSPVYNLHQNDVIYVEPNRVKMGQSTNNDNSVRQISTWLSVSSVLISLGILIFR